MLTCCRVEFQAAGTSDMWLASRYWQLKVASIPLTESPLCGYLYPLADKQRVIPYPAAGSSVPLWNLGLSMYGASVAAHLGLPFFCFPARV